MTAGQDDQMKPAATRPEDAAPSAGTSRGEDLAATVQRMRRQQEAISAASLSDAFVAGDVDRLAREMTELAARATGVERANVWLFNEDESELRCVDLYEATPGRHSAGGVLSESHYRNEFASMRKARFVDADDPLTDPRTAGYIESYLKPLRITSMLDAVIEVSGHRLGLLCLEHVDKPHHWERDEVAFACQFADQVALSLINRARREAQETLRASEARYRRLFESAKDGILILDAESAAVTDTNPALQDFLGYSREDILGRRPWELPFFVDPVAARAGFDEVVEKGFVRNEEMTLRTRDGRMVQVEFICNVYLVNQRRVVQCNVRDLTARKQAEDQVRTLSRIVEQAPLSIAITDLAGALEYVNPAFCEVTGYSKDEILGQNPRVLKSGQTSPEVHVELWETLTTGRVWRGEFQNRKKDGEIYVEQAVVAPVVDPDGRTSHYVALKEDITERKRAEAALDESLREKQALLKEVHHRVKNNLQVISSLLRLEAGRSATPGTRDVLREMQGRILAMALLHETLYKSGEFGKVELAHYLRQLAEQFFRAQSLGSGTVRLDLALDTVHVGIDQAIPCGLIVNEMLTNSLKHGFTEGRNGTVRVAVRLVAEGQVQLEVSDDGAGLPPDFESRRSRSLGLQLISDLARQLGGHLDIGSGPGAVFGVTFGAVLGHRTGPTLRPTASPTSS